jgi:hypothetical protein
VTNIHYFYFCSAFENPGPVCYSCKEALTADGCDQITQCGVDEVIPYVVLPANGYSTTSIGIQYTNENSRYIPVTGNSNENDRYIPETGNTNGNDHYILIIGSYFIFVPWCSFSLIIGKISVKLALYNSNYKLGTGSSGKQIASSFHQK